MPERARKYEAFLAELAPIVDGEPDALERHAELLGDDDEARDLRYDAAQAARAIESAGDDYVPPADLEARVMDALERSGGAERASSSSSAPPGEEPQSPPERLEAEAERSTARASDEGALDERTIDAEVEGAPTPPPRIDRSSARERARWFGPLAGAAALAAAALLFVFARGQDERAPAPALAERGIAGTLEALERAASDGRSGVTLRRPGSDRSAPLARGAALAPGSIIRTDERTRARVVLEDGSSLILNHDTELELIADAPRSFRVREGDVVADIAHLEEAPNAFFHTAIGHVEVLGTKFELAATEELTVVRVSRGAVAVASADGRRSEVYAGEEGVLRPGHAPEVSPVTGLARALSWAELGGDAEAGDSLPGLGSLRARRPGEREDRERPLTIASQKVMVRIVGNVARTEVEQVFRNDDEHTLEGIYRFPLPPDAQIARLALDVDGRMEEGSFVERDRAAAIWRGVIRNATPQRHRAKEEEFIWVPGPWIDPAILEWQRGGEFELRIFPIPAHGERRVILAYTQTLAPQGDGRRYVYPLAHAADGSTRVHRFDVDVRVAGAERVSASGYEVSTAAEGEATRLRLSERGFVPRGDLVIDYALPDAERELTYWSYRGEAAAPPPAKSREQDREVLEAHRALAADERGYVAFALRPKLPRMTERRARDYVYVVDASQSMVGERYQRAARLSAAAIAEMDRRDRFTVLACDYTCRALPGGVQAPSAEAARRAGEWLEDLEPAGASDLLASIRRLDPEALTAKSDLLGRLGHRDEALRLLTGTVDLVPHSEALHERLASAFERAERPERACAHRIALAEIDGSDARALAAAVRCERALGRDEAATRLLGSVRNERVRARAEREASRDPRETRFGGDFTIEGEWDDDVDLDLGIVTPAGARLSWMGGRTTVRGEDATQSGREKLGLRFTGVGRYYVEVSRVDPNDRREVRGRLRIRALGETRIVPFTLRGDREAVAQVSVRREARLVPGDPPPR